MKKPNQELFRLLRFAINYPHWQPYQKDAHKHILRGVELGFFEVRALDEQLKVRQFRLKKMVQ